MKYINLIHVLSLIFFILTPKLSAEKRTTFNQAEIKFNAKAVFPKKDENKIGNSVEGDAGLKLVLGNIDLRFYDSLKNTELVLLKERFTENIQKPRYGIGILFFEDKFPTTIKIGKNTYSKSISKIKNPTPSITANPLVKSFSFAGGIGSSLPTITSSEQPISASMSMLFQKNTTLSFSLDIFADENGNSAISISSSKTFWKFNTIKAVFTGARFFIENNSSILWKANAQFEGDFFYSGLAEISLRSPIIKSNLRIGIQESPYEINSVWFKFDSRTAFRNFLVDFSYFAIPTSKNSPKVAPIIGASSSIQRTMEQAEINPQMIFQLQTEKPTSIRLGIHAIETWKITSTKNAELLNIGKLRGAACIERKNFDLKYDFTLANVLLSGTPPNKSSTPEKYVSNSISADFRSKKAIINSEVNVKYYPRYDSNSDPKQTFDSSISSSLGKGKSLTVREKLSLTFKNSQRSSGEFSMSASYKFGNKKINSAIKCEIAVPF